MIGQAIVLALAIMLSGAAFGADRAFAWNEVTNVIDATDSPLPVRTTCVSCHSSASGSVTPDGVHGGYLSTTSKCTQCHSVHSAPADSTALLPAATITATCNACHDGTGGEGVYGAILGRTGVQPAANHSTETTSMVPGGDPVSGGSMTGTFSGVDGALTCTDCHSPHGANVITAFQGDRERAFDGQANPVSTKLLKQQPGSSTTATTEYGSDWCLSCHAGRASGLPTTHNHPVETSATAAPAAPYVYRNVPVLTGTSPTALTVLGGMGGTNAGYLMPYPRTTGVDGQSGHGPICQQCHEDTRNVGTLSAAGAGTPAAFQVSTPVWTQADGWNSSDNPRFQSFPHETAGYRMLVEATQTAYFDDLCLNCHPTSQLP